MGSSLARKRAYRLLRQGNADLRGIVLADLDFTDWDFTGAKMAGCDLRGSDFSRAKLDKCDVSKARFDLAVLLKTSLRETFAEETDFANALLWKSDLSLGWFIGCNFTGATIGHLRAVGTLFADCRFDAAGKITGPHDVRPRTWQGKVPVLPFATAEGRA